MHLFITPAGAKKNTLRKGLASFIPGNLFDTIMIL
jgi:hypothetical protein